MPDNKNSREIEEALMLLHDLMESNRINMEILEILKLKGRIKLTDRDFIEISELERKHQREFQLFVVKKLPQFMEGDLTTTQNLLRKTFLTWATDLLISLRYLDGLMKKYLAEIHAKDLKNLRALQEGDVKDKRFWKFLDKVKSKSRIFESFEEPEEIDALEISEESQKVRNKRAEMNPDPESDHS